MIKKEVKLTKAKIAKLEKKERNKKDREWQLAVKQRDGSKCIINKDCGNVAFVHTHHIIPRENKLFRWDVDNGICLCPKHHKYDIVISPHKNPLIFYKWLLENRYEQLTRLIEKYKLLNN